MSNFTSVEALLLICLLEYFDLSGSDFELCVNLVTGLHTCICSEDDTFCANNVEFVREHCNLTSQVGKEKKIYTNYFFYCDVCYTIFL